MPRMRARRFDPLLVTAVVIIVGRVAVADAQQRVAVLGDDRAAVAALVHELGAHHEVVVVPVAAAPPDDGPAAAALAVRFQLNAIVTVRRTGGRAAVVAYEGLDGFVLGRYQVRGAEATVANATAALLWKKLGPAIAIALPPGVSPGAPAGASAASAAGPAPASAGGAGRVGGAVGASATADAAGGAATTAAGAAPAPGPGAPATAAAPSWHDRLTLAGLVDAYVAISLCGELDRPSALRTFDGASSSFTLAYAELAVAMAPAPAGLRLDLGFGPVADLSSLEPAGDPPVVGPSEVMKHVQQAYASLAVPGTAVVVDAGRFVTPVGAEYIEAKDDWLYSRSLLFGYAIPFAHTGVRITAPLSARLTVQAMVVNGWDLAADDNRAKTVGASVSYGGTGASAALNVLAGEEGDEGRVLVDAIVGLRTSSLAWSLNVDAARSGDTTWYGAATMARWAIGRHLALAARAERFVDPDGVRTGVAGGVTVSEATAGVALRVGDGAEVRLEGRVDHATAPVFADGTTQATLTAAALAWF